ncbi:WD-40 repeat protein, partial [Reticulomyxa filosa]
MNEAMKRELNTKLFENEELKGDLELPGEMDKRLKDISTLERRGKSKNINMPIHHKEKKNLSVEDKSNEDEQKHGNNDNKNTLLSSSFLSDNSLVTLKGHKNYVWSVDYLPFDDRHYLCSGSEDNKICVWDIDNAEKLNILNMHSSYVFCVKFSPYHTSPTICSASWDKTIRFWDLKASEEIQILNEHTNGVCSIQFSPFNGGRYLCSGSGDNTIRLWDMEMSKSLHVFNGHEDY